MFFKGFTDTSFPSFPLSHPPPVCKGGGMASDLLCFLHISSTMNTNICIKYCYLGIGDEKIKLTHTKKNKTKMVSACCHGLMHSLILAFQGPSQHLTFCTSTGPWHGCILLTNISPLSSFFPPFLPPSLSHHLLWSKPFL